jgi:hypothetical protein
MIRTIDIQIIPHNAQRYRTAGDWIYNAITSNLSIKVSDTGDWRESISVAIHELAESVLCIDRGISQKEVDEFDIQFEKDRDAGKVKYDEPGVDPRAPYYDEHAIATIIENIITKGLRLNSDAYNQHLDDLDKEWGE